MRLCGETAPGTLRDRWLEQVTDRLLRQRVTALASAGLASLQTLDADALAERAARYGPPMPDELAEEIAGHFVAKRAAALTCRR